MRISELLGRADRELDRRPDAGRRRSSARREVPPHDAREPRRRRARVAARDARDPRAARQGLRDVHVGRGVPAAVRVPQLPLDGLHEPPPDDLDERTIVFLDCGNIDRMPVDFLQRDDAHIVNIDHHHDNTRFGTANLVVGDASCTAEIVWRLAKELGVEITPEIAERALRRARHRHRRVQYENTTPEAHRMAADLIEAGVDAHGIYRRLYENVPFAGCSCSRARCPRRALRRRRAHGLAPRAERLRGDRRRRDRLRGHRRPPARGEGHARRGARARAARRGPRRHPQGQPARDRQVAWTCRAIARGHGGGGHTAGGRLLDRHRRYPELVERPAQARSASSSERCIGGPGRAVPLRTPTASSCRKPAGVTSHDVVARVRRGLRARHEGRPRRHARPVRDRPAARAGRPGHARAALLHGAAEDLPAARPARLALRHRRSATATLRGTPAASTGAASSSRPASSCSARPLTRPCKVGGERLYRKARRGEAPEPGRGRSPSRALELLDSHGERATLELECSTGTYVRSSAIADARTTPTARSSSARAIGPFRLEDADPERLVPLERGARRSCRSARSIRRGGRAWRATGVAAAGETAPRSRVVRLTARRRAGRGRRAARRRAPARRSVRAVKVHALPDVQIPQSGRRAVASGRSTACTSATAR